jgi:hypothetical protein
MGEQLQQLEVATTQPMREGGDMGRRRGRKAVFCREEGNMPGGSLLNDWPGKSPGHDPYKQLAATTSFSR